MALTFYTLDVFTEQRLTGNPLAVVMDADALTDEQMLAIAREFNLSETVFLVRTEKPAHTARTRIFTPQREVPFAGHPSIGVAALLAELRTPATQGEEKDALIVLEQGAGTVRAGVRLRPGSAAYAELDAPKVPVEAGMLQPPEILAAGLGLIPNEIGFENHKPSCFAAGNAFAYVPITSLEAIGRARINGAQWERAFEDQGVLGVYLYTRQCEHTSNAFHARLFAPGAGIPEDPATGSGAVGLAGVIHHFDQLPDGMHKRVIEQGYEMGRPSQITISIEVEKGALTNVRLGGASVRVSKGELEI